MALFHTRIIVPAILSALLIGYIYRGDLQIGDQINGKSLSRSIGHGGSTQTLREFDFFKLALQWPPTNCRYTRRCCDSNACCRGSESPNYFTIHGLWPCYNDGTWPACCSGSEFNKKEISALVVSLNKYWPSLSCNKVSTCHGKKGSFWAHEWEKHGTCSYPVVRDEYDYFIRTINIYFKYNVTEVLREEGYVPSNYEKYPLGGIISAIQNAFHATPEIQCKGDAVEELRLCFFKDLKLRECNAGSNIKDGISSCPKYVSLPAYTPRDENSGSGTSSI